MRDDTCLKEFMEENFSGEYAWFGEGRSGIREHFTITHVASWVTPESIAESARIFYKSIDFKDSEIPRINVSQKALDDSEVLLEVRVDPILKNYNRQLYSFCPIDIT